MLDIGKPSNAAGGLSGRNPSGQGPSRPGGEARCGSDELCAQEVLSIDSLCAPSRTTLRETEYGAHFAPFRRCSPLIWNKPNRAARALN